MKPEHKIVFKILPRAEDNVKHADNVADDLHDTTETNIVNESHIDVDTNTVNKSGSTRKSVLVIAGAAMLMSAVGGGSYYAASHYLKCNKPAVVQAGAESNHMHEHEHGHDDDAHALHHFDTHMDNKFAAHTRVEPKSLILTQSDYQYHNIFSTEYRTYIRKLLQQHAKDGKCLDEFLENIEVAHQEFFAKLRLAIGAEKTQEMMRIHKGDCFHDIDVRAVAWAKKNLRIERNISTGRH
jgi:hypothetical protein